jgi:DNA replication and repair protein RecF
LDAPAPPIARQTLTHLYLRNFRNYSEAEVQFSPSLNIFYGQNAQGKTNLLEAIYLVSTGRSFRAEQLADLISEGQTYFYLDALVEKENVKHRIQISFDGQTKKLLLDNNQYTTLQHLMGLLPSVLYTPADGELIEGAPALRRRFLNLHLGQSDPLYIHHLSRYWRAMKQRNALLKSKDVAGIDPFEEEMATSASYLFHKRRELIEHLSQSFAVCGTELSGKREAHEIRFLPSFPATANAYRAQLHKHRPRELQMAQTLTGPHRDDFYLLINTKPARGFASEGQKKTALAALKLAERRLLSATTGSQALLGIDDFGLHLDEQRHSLFQHQLRSLGQVFITAPDVPDGWNASEHPQLFHISAGRIAAQNSQVGLA